MPFRPRRFARKGARYAKRQFNRRYKSKAGGFRVARLARDMRYVKSQLNVEHKYIDNDIQTFHASSTGFSNQYPYIERLTMPRAGTANNERVGNEIKVSHISYRLDCDASVFQDSTIDKVSIKVSLLCAWNPDDVVDNDTASAGGNANNTTAEVMLVPTIVGSENYPPYAYTNKPNYKKYVRLHSEIKSLSQLLQIKPDDVGITHSKNVHLNGSFKCNFKPQFEIGSSNLDVLQPFIMIQTDSPGNSLSTGGVSSEPQWKVVGKVRMTYIDN